MTAAHARGTELGRYLKARRAQVRPEDVGLPAGAGVRRTPGLRREELAALAGVSVDYYIRLERGRETNPSPAVVDALGRTLGLRGDGYERLHELAELASGRPTELPACPDHAVRGSVLRMLESVRPLPAYVVSRYNRVLAANPPGRRLMPGLWDWPEEQRNLTRYVFLHPVGRTLYEPWEETVALSVAHLRAVGGADPDSPELTALVGELMLKSAQFARIPAGTAPPHARHRAPRPGDPRPFGPRVRRAAAAPDVRSGVHGRQVARLLRHLQRCRAPHPGRAAACRAGGLGSGPAAGAMSAWRISLAEVGMVYGTVPFLWITLMPGGGAGTVPARVSLVPLRDLGPIGIGGNLLVFAGAGALHPDAVRGVRVRAAGPGARGGLLGPGRNRTVRPATGPGDLRGRRPGERHRRRAGRAGVAPLVAHHH